MTKNEILEKAEGIIGAEAKTKYYYDACMVAEICPKCGNNLKMYPITGYSYFCGSDIEASKDTFYSLKCSECDFKEED